MPNIGPLELTLVLVIALLVLGPKRLPDAARSLGRSINEFRHGLADHNRDRSETPEPSHEDLTDESPRSAATTDPQSMAPPARDPARRPSADQPIGHS
jgi:sec-independent protein translocase protein TatA